MICFWLVHLDRIMRKNSTALSVKIPFKVLFSLNLQWICSWKTSIITQGGGLQADVGCLAGVGPVSLPSVLMTAWPQQSVIKAEKTRYNTAGRGTSLYNEHCARGRETAPAVASLWEQAPPPAVGRGAYSACRVLCSIYSTACTVRSEVCSAGPRVQCALPAPRAPHPLVSRHPTAGGITCVCSIVWSLRNIVKD